MPTPLPCSATTTYSRRWRDKATVPVYYESRLAKLASKASEKPKNDPELEEATDGEELSHKENRKTKWAALESVVGAEKRIGLIAADFVKHWEARLEVMDGKAMVVCILAFGLFLLNLPQGLAAGSFPGYSAVRRTTEDDACGCGRRVENVILRESVCGPVFDEDFFGEETLSQYGQVIMDRSAIFLGAVRPVAQRWSAFSERLISSTTASPQSRVAFEQFEQFACPCLKPDIQTIG